MSIVLQVISIFTSIYVALSENKRNIYIVTFIFNLIQLSLMILGKDWVTMFTYIIICFRSFMVMRKDKCKTPIIPIVVVAAHIISGVIFMESYWQILPIIAPCIVTCYMWYGKDTQHLRIGNITTASIWFVYNFHCGLYGVCISRIIAIISNIVGFIRHKKLK